MKRLEINNKGRKKEGETLSTGAQYPRRLEFSTIIVELPSNL
jgi:hypothetical protein